MSRQFSVAYNQSETILAHYGLLTGYLCFSAQDSILIICHAIIVGDTKGWMPLVPSGHGAKASDEENQVGTNIQLTVILLEVAK
ncbi:MAG: hypothetical protein WBA85_04050 [Brucella anthropi]